MRKLSKDQEGYDLLAKMAENKDEFVEILRNAEDQEETMKRLTECYEEGDLARL